VVFNCCEFDMSVSILIRFAANGKLSDVLRAASLTTDLYFFVIQYNTIRSDLYMR
jgi:hypothetical protein